MMRDGGADTDSALAFDTERLQVRPLTEGDEALYCSLYTDVETMRFIAPPLSAGRAARSFHAALRLTRRRPMQHVFLSLIHKTTRQPVGICSLQGVDLSLRRAEAGMVIASAFRALGFGVESLSALVTMAFTALPIDEVWAQTAFGHALAERLVVKVGFAPRGSVEPTRERSGQRLWSAFRESWRYV